MSGMLLLSGMSIIGGIGFVIFGLLQRSREACRTDALGGASSGHGLPSSTDGMAPLEFLGERPGPDEGILGHMGGQAEEELTGQSKTGASLVKKTGSLWDSLKAPMRAFRRKERREEKIPLDIPTATGTALIPKSVKTDPEVPGDGELSS